MKEVTNESEEETLDESGAEEIDMEIVPEGKIAFW